MATVRLATIEDRNIFMELWKEYLEIQEDLGDFMRATESTLSVYEAFFLDAVQPGKGVVVIAEDGDYPCGALMRVKLCLPFDITLGKTAMSFGIYVRKEFQNQGIAKRLAGRAAIELKKHNFDTVLSEVMTGNGMGDRYSDSMGYKIVRTVRILSLGDNS